MMVQYSFILGSKCTVWRRGINNEEGYACVGAGGGGGSLNKIFVPSSSFSCKPKTALRKQSF